MRLLEHSSLPHPGAGRPARCTAVPAPLFPRPCQGMRYVGTHAAAIAALEGMSGAQSAWAASVQQRLPPPVISKSAEALAKSGVEIISGPAEVSLDELNDLFERVKFPRRDPAKLAEALQNSHTVLWVRSVRRSRWAKLGQLLGFARATSDGALVATVWDVAVLPAWQRSGLGRALMERLLAGLIAEGISTITLFAEPGVVTLYERLGFVRDPQGIKGMSFQKSTATGEALALSAMAGIL